MCILGNVDCIIRWAINLIVKYHVSENFLKMSTTHQTPRVGKLMLHQIRDIALKKIFTMTKMEKRENGCS